MDIQVIKTNLICHPIGKYDKHVLIPIEQKYHGIKKFGRTTMYVVCPCCDNTNEVFIWSYAGKGKKCTNCKVLLSGQYAFLPREQVVKNFTIIGNTLVKHV